MPCPDCAGRGIGDWSDCSTCDGSGRVAVAPLKLALDLGFGGHRREWEGYRVYTTDIRPDSKPDYVQDTRALNLPDGHYDLVASSHHLEHIPRFEQERAWAEIFRVTKPGGRTEHYVPSLEWAAAKIADGQADEHVFNVVFGAQEMLGFGREYNTHYFGYTKAIAKSLAESVGFVDVELEDWRDGNPALVYNLIIRARKPEAEGALNPVPHTPAAPAAEAGGESPGSAA